MYNKCNVVQQCNSHKRNECSQVYQLPGEPIKLNVSHINIGTWLSYSRTTVFTTGTKSKRTYIGLDYKKF